MIGKDPALTGVGNPFSLGDPHPGWSEADHFPTVGRHVERNALRANLVKQAENGRWSSLGHRQQQTQVPWLSEGPVARPGQGTEYVNGAETASELASLRRWVVRGAPYGAELWPKHTAAALGLPAAFRSRGRQKQAIGD
jgi:putative transposase